MIITVIHHQGIVMGMDIIVLTIILPIVIHIIGIHHIVLMIMGINL